MKSTENYPRYGQLCRYTVCCVFSGQDGLALTSHQIKVCEESKIVN